MRLYLDFEDQAQLDAMYDVGAAETDPTALQRQQFAFSEEIREKLTLHAHLPYGLTREEYLDVFPAEDPNAPVVVFFHGGYWSYPITADNYSLVANGLVARGITTVVVNYSLAPAVTLDEITRQARAAVVWTYQNIASYGGDPERIYISGHSAGGQLVGMLALTDWEGEYLLPADVIKGGLALSGLFDLTPFPYTWLGPKLLLTTETIRRQSPLLNVRAVPVPLVVAYGGLESAEFSRQSAEFAQAWRSAGNITRLVELSDETHLKVCATYSEAESQLTELTASLVTRGLDGSVGEVEVLHPTAHK